MKSVSTLALLLAAGLATSAHAELRLKPHAVAEGSMVKIGDLFDGAGDKAGIAIVPAPQSGTRVFYDPRDLAQVMRAHGLNWQPAPRQVAIAVEAAAAGDGFSHEELSGLLLQAMTDRGLRGQLELDLAGRKLELSSPRRGTDVQVELLDLDTETGRFQARLLATPRRGEAEDLRIHGVVQAVHQVPVLERTVKRGDVIDERDVSWTELRAAPGASWLITNSDDIVGQAARRTLRAGSTVRQRDLTAPILVTKGALVTMTLTAPGLLLSGNGRALEDGAAGDTIKIMNPQSKRTVEAVVVGPADVRVSLPRQVAAVAAR